MHSLKRVVSLISSPFTSLNLLHALNDAYETNFILLLPFIAKDLELNLILVGILGSLMFSFSIILALPSAYIAVKFGGIKTLIFAVFIYGFGMLGVGFSGNYFYLLLAFVLGGIGFGLFHPVALALIAKWTSIKNRGTAMGSFSAVGDLGKIGITSSLTFIVIYLGWQGTARLFGICAILIAILFYLFLIKRNDSYKDERHKSSSVSISELLKNNKFVFAGLTNVFDNFASQTLFLFLPFLLLSRGYSPAILGLFAGAFFIGSFLGRIILGKFVDKYTSTNVFIISELLMALIIVLLANVSQLYLILGCSLILGIFTKGTNPIVKTMVSESVEHHGNYEKAYGMNSITSNMAIAIAPIILGFISEKFGIIAAFNVMAFVALLAIIPAMGFKAVKSMK